MDVIRLAGPPGVGKSTLAQRIAQERSSTLPSVGYVDIDQLGMLYPAPEGDDDRWALKERALIALAAVHRERGTRLLLVSGVADPVAPPPETAPGRTRSLWLTAEPETLHARLQGRGWGPSMVEETVATGSAESRRRHPDWTGLPVDGVDEAQAAAAVQEHLATAAGSAPPGEGEAPGGRLADHAPSDREQRAEHDALTTPVLWVTGPRCAGASSVAWSLASGGWAQGRRTGFLDLAQLSFRRSVGGDESDGVVPDAAGPVSAEAVSAEAWQDPALGLDVLAAVAAVLVGAGMQELVVTAPFPVQPAQVRAALPGAPVRVVRLHDEPGALRERALRRRAGEGPMLAGDDLIGASDEQVEAALERASRERAVPPRDGEETLEVHGRTPEELASLIRDGAGPSGDTRDPAPGAARDEAGR
ncbi:AAA family ATPase [Brachybacterium sp. NBEC-018]|uniref:AAA family ATPase n=1 Tax=Brachybacterium sp. NBEC-018 TaxID=2996004 RepID=UPI002175187F|nr:AAA family ATPase [Brachybacterium sp. NBEC-018]UVY82487.1 AAA family ATPase [Brachybacterium sp. NBEC-018]